MALDFEYLENVERDFTVSASPSWQGVNSKLSYVKINNKHFLLQEYYQDILPYVDFHTVCLATKIAGQLGIGLEVANIDLESASIVYKKVNESYRFAGLHDLIDEKVRKSIIESKKKFQNNESMTQKDQTFELIHKLSESIKRYPLLCPKRIDEWDVFAKKAEKILKSDNIEFKPCHLDGNISNIMISESNNIKIVNFDMASLADPLQDVGCYLMEVYELKKEAEKGYIEWFGEFDSDKFEKAWLYGIIDDLKWGLIAMNMAAVSPRKDMEFGKYASWRLLRFVENKKYIQI